MIAPNPQAVVWEYTLGCDSGCLHCGSNAKIARKNELTTIESLNLVEQIADLGFWQIILSGGEPTLRRDWPKIAEKIKSMGMEFGIISNALAWTPKTIDTLASIEPFSVGFSVDGEEKLHDYLRGANGSFKKVFAAIKELKKRDATVCAVTAVNKRNLEELTKIRNRLIVYGVDAWQIQMASPMGRMADHMDIVLNQEEYYRLGEFIAETKEYLPDMNIQGADCIGYLGKLGPKVRDVEWNGCMAGIQGMGIESDGGIKGCLSIHTPGGVQGNIRERPLREIWEDPNNFLNTRGFKPSDLGGECTGCDYGSECKGGCSSQSIAFFGEYHRAPYCFLRYEQGGNGK